MRAAESQWHDEKFLLVKGSEEKYQLTEAQAKCFFPPLIFYQSSNKSGDTTGLTGGGFREPVEELFTCVADHIFWLAGTLLLEELPTHLTGGSFTLVCHLQQTSGQGVTEEFP